MKGYYKNWYQHYLELEQQKKKDEQRGYYSNLAPEDKKSKAEKQFSEGRAEKNNKVLEEEPVIIVKKKKRKHRLLGVLLPITTIMGFVFLWYQMDIGPIRQFVNDALVVVGIREEAIDVIGYHTSLLDQHVTFAENVAMYINGEDELTFTDLELMYNEIRASHRHVVEISREEHAEAVRIWSIKISNVTHMMNGLLEEDDIGEIHVQFIADQQEMVELIRAELVIGEEL